MRLIVLMASLLIAGLLIYHQVGPGSGHLFEVPSETSNSSVPKVPARPQDVQKFGQDMSNFMNDAASDQARRIEQSGQ
jgi:hypothetical protein